MTPLRFVFGLHLHQPVGNFDHVFEQHLDDVYRPLLETPRGARVPPGRPALSGPLLEWLEAHEPALPRPARPPGGRRPGRAAPRGLLRAGPGVACRGGTGWSRSTGCERRSARRFGVEATGLWLTERVWEPELAADLADAGVRYALVDDRHFLVTGFRREQLHAPFWTESDGKRVALFPDRRAAPLPDSLPAAGGDRGVPPRARAAAGQRLAVLADDGEKFGGWPGTREWVYEKGWLDGFLHAIARTGGARRGPAHHSARSAGRGAERRARLSADRVVSGDGGLVAPARRRRAGSPRSKRDLGEDRMAGPDGALVRGAHWRNFLVKYAESNRMHKKMLALSTLCRARGRSPRGAPGDRPGAVQRRLLARRVRRALPAPPARCGLAEARARGGVPAHGRGARRGSVSTSTGMATTSSGSTPTPSPRGQPPSGRRPSRSFTVFAPGINYANILTRRREAYHDLALERQADSGGHSDGGTASIHDIEAGIRLDGTAARRGRPRAARRQRPART